MTLRLVREELPKPKRRKWTRAPLLTPAEEARFRAAMKNLQGAFGSWGALASAMGANYGAIKGMMYGVTHVSGDMIVRAMRAGGVTLAELISGPVAADRCRACGRVRAA